jgi:hypothetical protein
VVTVGATTTLPLVAPPVFIFIPVQESEFVEDQVRVEVAGGTMAAGSGVRVTVGVVGAFGTQLVLFQ